MFITVAVRLKIPLMIFMISTVEGAFKTNTLSVSLTAAVWFSSAPQVTLTLYAVSLIANPVKLTSVILFAATVTFLVTLPTVTLNTPETVALILTTIVWL